MGHRGLDGRFLGYVVNTWGSQLPLPCCVSSWGAARLCLPARRRPVDGMAGEEAATVGYAVPGPVVAIGVLILLSAVDAALDAVISLGAALVTGTVAGLLYAYGIRFLALAFGSIDAGLEKVAPSLTLAALSLGARPSRGGAVVHLPLLRPGIGVALVLVAVDALKELPIMLLLRPFGFETLAVWVNQRDRVSVEVGWAAGA